MKILNEVKRTLVTKLGATEAQASRRVQVMDSVFPDARVDGYQHLITSMTNHIGDRHVLAAAVQCGASAIVTNNRRHFPAESLAPFGIECLSADEFIRRQYHVDPDGMTALLRRQAEDVGWTMEQLLQRHVSCLAELI